MPTVPRYSTPLVKEQPLPGVQISPNSSAEAFGGGSGQFELNRANERLADSVAAYARNERDKADQLVALDVGQKLSDFETKTLYDSKTGLLNVRGKDALGLPDQLQTNYQTFSQDILKKLSNDSQRYTAQRMIDSHGNDMNRQVQRHVSSETKKWDESVTDSFLINERNAASQNYHDPERINTSIGRQQKTIVDYGMRNGQPQDSEPIKRMIADAQSKTHLAVVSRMLANEEDQTADKYVAGLKLNATLSDPNGLVVPGNIDIYNRPQVKTPEGVATVRSKSWGIDGKEVLLPTVSDDGKLMSDAEAVAQYKKTGKHLGIFADVASANAFGDKLHNQQDGLLKNKVIGTVSGGDLIHIEKSLEEGKVRGESQRQADFIFNQKGTLSESLGVAAQIKDPKVRDETERRLEHKFQQVESSKSLTQKNLYMESSNLIDKNPEVPARELIPPATWIQLTPEQRNALESRAEAPVANDSKGWLNFMTLKPGELARMDKADFQIYWSKFDREHRSRAESMWNSAREAGDKAAMDPKLTSVVNAHDQLINSLKVSNLIDPNKSVGKYTEREAGFLAQIENAAAKKVEEFELTQLGGKRKSTYDERQKIYDDLTIKKVFIEKSWARDVEKPTVLVTEEDKKGGAVMYVPLEKIPEADKNNISNILRSKQKKITQRKLERAYGAFMLGDRQLFDQIIGE